MREVTKRERLLMARVRYLFGKPKVALIESQDKIGHNSMHSIQQAKLKSGHLLHKMAQVWSPWANFRNRSYLLIHILGLKYSPNFPDGS